MTGILPPLPPPIKAIIFSEFHHLAGPVLTYQAPEDFLSKDVFDVVHVFIITKPQLYQKLITVNAVSLQILGCPQSIEDKKYKRNALLFNFGLVFDPNADTAPFEPIVKKLARCFRSLELESEFLSQETTKAKLPNILDQILKQLNAKGYCAVPADEANSICLKVVPDCCDAPAVLDHQVPIFCIDQLKIAGTTWDLTIQQVLPYIDGFNHVNHISQKSSVDLSLVRLCIQHLLHHDVIKLISIFQYSNVYATLPAVSQLIENEELAEECLTFVTKRGNSRPSIKDVFSLYCALCHGVTVKDLCTARHETQGLGIDERRFIQFGLMKGLIARVQKYPVLLGDKPSVGRLKPFSSMLTGKHNMDEICCHSELSYQELDTLIEADPHLVVCWK
ncbi:GATOR1 complex protein NPRL2-like isoform X2 [Oscarella lobularis]|uniref:GATOR1 complex protein NPRL2-like isoform X2 n=1 Tax=Oscarella lobularis TaxID=121494 RepID=UPI0033133B1C